MANQFLKLNVVKATFDPSGDATKRVIAAHSSGVFIPAGAIIMKSMYETSNTSISCLCKIFSKHGSPFLSS